MKLSITVPDEMYQEILHLSRDNIRTVGQEVLYRLEQGLRMTKHISKNDESLLNLIFQEKNKRVLDS